MCPSIRFAIHPKKQWIMVRVRENATSHIPWDADKGIQAAQMLPNSMLLIVCMSRTCMQDKTI